MLNWMIVVALESGDIGGSQFQCLQEEIGKLDAVCPNVCVNGFLPS